MEISDYFFRLPVCHEGMSVVYLFEYRNRLRQPDPGNGKGERVNNQGRSQVRAGGGRSQTEVDSF